MIDVSGKPESERWAVARGSVVVARETLELIKAAELQKGDVLSVAEIAGVMGAKRTAELIPLCHPLPLTHVEVQADLAEDLPMVLAIPPRNRGKGVPPIAQRHPNGRDARAP